MELLGNTACRCMVSETWSGRVPTWQLVSETNGSVLCQSELSSLAAAALTRVTASLCLLVPQRGWLTTSFVSRSRKASHRTPTCAHSSRTSTGSRAVKSTRSAPSTLSQPARYRTQERPRSCAAAWVAALPSTSTTSRVGRAWSALRTLPPSSLKPTDSTWLAASHRDRSSQPSHPSHYPRSPQPAARGEESLSATRKTTTKHEAGPTREPAPLRTEIAIQSLDECESPDSVDLKTLFCRSTVTPIRVGQKADFGQRVGASSPRDAIVTGCDHTFRVTPRRQPLTTQHASSAAPRTTPAVGR